MGKASARSLSVTCPLWEQSGRVLCPITSDRHRPNHSRSPGCGEARRCNEFACHWPCRFDCDGKHFYRFAWICALSVSVSKPGTLCCDQCFAEYSDPSANGLDQPEVGSAGPGDGPLHVWTGRRH